MAKTYTKAEPEVMNLLLDVLRRHHKELIDLQIRIGVLMVRPPRTVNGEPKGAAIKVRGVPAAACMWLTTAKDRVHMPYDAIIEIDADRWDRLGDKERAALLDHEVTHIVVLKDKNGGVETDEDLRPKLRTRPDEWTLSGFAEVIHRHGEAALEWQAVNKLVDQYGQLLFPWSVDRPRKRTAAIHDDRGRNRACV